MNGHAWTGCSAGVRAGRTRCDRGGSDGIAVAGCDDSDKPSVSGATTAYDKVRASSVLSAKDIARYPAGSPARRALEWWRSLQFRNARSALRAFTKEVRAELLHENTTSSWRTSLDRGARCRPTILNTEVDGDRATVFMRLLVVEPVGDSAYRRRDEYLALPMLQVKSERTWFLADSSFLVGQAQVLVAVQRTRK